MVPFVRPGGRGPSFPLRITLLLLLQLEHESRPGEEAPVPHNISAARHRPVVSRDKDCHPGGADCAAGGRSGGCQRKEERKVSRPKGGMHRGRVSSQINFIYIAPFHCWSHLRARLDHRFYNIIHRDPTFPPCPTSGWVYTGCYSYLGTWAYHLLRGVKPSFGRNAVKELAGEAEKGTFWVWWRSSSHHMGKENIRPDTRGSATNILVKKAAYFHMYYAQSQCDALQFTWRFSKTSGRIWRWPVVIPGELMSGENQTCSVCRTYNKNHDLKALYSSCCSCVVCKGNF